MAQSPTDEFVNIWTADGDGNGDNEFHRDWSTNTAAAKHPSPTLQAINALRKIYPEHSVVATDINLLSLPALLTKPLPNAPLVSTLNVLPVSRSQGGEVAGVLTTAYEFAAFQAAWDVRIVTGAVLRLSLLYRNTTSLSMSLA
jgi:transitional endoplasmic reticulum ATPase